MQKTIAVDFDGVIHKYSNHWQGGIIYDHPCDDVQKSLKDLVEDGFRIVIFTTRTNFCDIAVWLNDNGMQLDTHYHDITNIKPKALAYIDDRAVRFTNWIDVRKMF